jgi:hypothetical protein
MRFLRVVVCMRDGVRAVEVLGEYPTFGEAETARLNAEGDYPQYIIDLEGG